MRILFINIWLIIICNNCFSQSFKSYELKEIYALWQKNGSSLNCEIIKDTLGKIVHIGLPLFKNDVKKNTNTYIADFLERYNLYFRLLDKTDRDIIIRDKKLEVDVEKFFKADSLCDFALNFDGKKYTALWQKDGFVVCSFGFENNFNLIFGLNAAESQQYFIDEVLNFKAAGKHQNNNYEYTIENIAAGLLKGYTLNVTHNLYNYEKKKYAIQFYDFANYCISNNCTVFVGVERVENDTITATIIYKNSDFGYNHLLYLKIPQSVLTTKRGEIFGSLNTFIPTHNVKKLYNDKL